MAIEPTSLQIDSKLPTRAVWDRLSPGECDAIARQLAKGLPPPWTFLEIRHQAMDDQTRDVAFFDYDGDEFALIPGGSAALGYDRNAPPSVSEEWCHEYGAVWELRPEEARSKLLAYFDSCMTPLRTVTIVPLLLETVAKDFSGDIVTPIEIPRPGGGVTVYRKQAGRTWTHREVLGEVCRDGFRLPTPDEWEYACGAGSRSFWRWGNEGPPQDDSLWRLNELPNAFGLRIAEDSYGMEWCRPPDQWRGGDGGSSACGCEGDVIIWSTLATAYTCPIPVEVGGKDFLDTQMFGRCRRAFPLTYI